MRLVDLSHTLNSSISIYPGDLPFCSVPSACLSKDGCNVHSLSLSSHAGTHIDAPYHFIENGKKIDEIPLEWLVGEALIIDITKIVREKYRIEWKDLEAYEGRMKELGQNEGGMVLIRTGWDRYWGTEKYSEHPFLSQEAARKIVEAGIRTLGVDTFSPDKTTTEEADFDFSVHKVVLGSGCLIAENLTNLAALDEPNTSWMISLIPLKIEGCDGSPIRAYAQEKSSRPNP